MRKYIDIIQYALTEGKVFPFRAGYAANGDDVLAYENPTEAQALTALQRCGKEPYLRGICVKNRRLITWNGWHATHDDARLEFFPKIPEYSGDITTFEAYYDKGANVMKYGDYDIEQCRYFQNIKKAVTTFSHLNTGSNIE